MQRATERSDQVSAAESMTASAQAAPTGVKADLRGRSRPGRKSGKPRRGARPSAERIDFTAIVRRYETPLLRYAAQVAGQTEAEDVVQEVFFRLHRQIARRGPASVRTVTQWVFRVCHNVALDVRQRRGRGDRARERARKAEPDDLDQLGELVRRAACERALEELGRLPEEQRQVLLLKVIQGMTLREIAKTTGLTLSQAALQLNLALAELARRMKEANVI